MKHVFLSFLLALLGLAAGPAAGQIPCSLTGKVLSVSDIHFGLSHLRYTHLAGKPLQLWEDSLRAHDKARLVLPSKYRQDANYWLLDTTLTVMHTTCPQPDFIVITGDFISHALSDTEMQGNRLTSEMDSVYLYLSWKFNATFPGTIVVPGLGNNDTDTGDDNPPSPGLLTGFATAWAPRLYPGDATAQNAFITDFKMRGYYKYRLPCPGGNHYLFMLNSVLFFGNGKGTGCSIRPEATAELTWLKKELAATAATDKLWMAMHVPYGIDVYQTLAPYNPAVLGCQDTLVGPPPHPQRVHATWHASAMRVYGALMTLYADRIVAGLAGHTHMDEFRLLPDITGKPTVFLHVTPSVSPFFRNNPGFQVLRYDPANQALLDAQTFFVNLNLSRPQPYKWRSEYSFQSAYLVNGINLTTLPAVQTRIQQFDTTATPNVYQWRYRTFYNDSAATKSTDPSPKIGKDWKFYWCATAAATPWQYCDCLANWPATASPQALARPARPRRRIARR